MELDGVSAENDLQSFERTAHAMFPNPSVYAAFKASQEGKVMKGFFKQPYELRAEFGLGPQRWVTDLRKTYPNAYLPTVQQICRKWMTTYAKQHQLQKQSGLTKKQWSALLTHAPSAVAHCVKEKNIKLESAKSAIMMAAIHDTYKVYYNKLFAGWATETFPELLNMIRLLRQKAIDKEELAQSPKLGDKEIALFNQLEARGYPDRELYNKAIYEPYLSKFVTRGANMNKNMFSLPEMIKSNYLTPEQVKKMIDDKYRRGDFNIKSEEDIKKLYEVAENVFNHMEDPKNSFNTVSAQTNDRNLTDKLYEISSNVGPLQLQNIINDNIKIENENNLNVPSSSSSSFSDLSSFKEEPKLPGEYEDESGSERETDTATASESEILPEDLSKAVQDNNSSSNTSIARPNPNFVPKPPSEQNLLRRAIDNQIPKFGSSVK
jgi:hypothetical protein